MQDKQGNGGTLNITGNMHTRYRVAGLVSKHAQTTNTDEGAVYIKHYWLKFKGIGSEIGQRPQTGIALLRCRRIITCITCIRVRCKRSIVYTAKRENTHIGLAQLCQSGGNKTAVSLIGRRAIEKITSLNKKVNALAYREIGRPLKSRAQTLLPLFTLARRLAGGSITQVVVGGEDNSDNLLLLPTNIIGSIYLLYFFLRVHIIHDIHDMRDIRTVCAIYVICAIRTVCAKLLL